MNRHFRRILVLSGLAIVAIAQQSFAQQTAQMAVINKDGEQQSFIVNPDGTGYMIDSDGNTHPIDPNNSPMPKFFKSGGSNSSNGDVVKAGASNITGANPAQMQQMMQQQVRKTTLTTLQTALGCSDQEWEVLKPKIQKILALQLAISPGSGMRLPQAEADTPSTATTLSQRSQEFQKLMNQAEVKDAEVSVALNLLRDARAKAKADLTQSCKELTALLTQHQEAVLFQKGVLAD